MRMVKRWHRLPREVIDGSSLETFKVRLDGALSNLIQSKMSPLTAGGVGYMAFRGSFQLKLFYDSVVPWDEPSSVQCTLQYLILSTFVLL